MNIEQKQNTITLTKTFNAPIDRVFGMFKNPHIQQWWGPTTWPLTHSDQDFSVGGTWHYCMTGPDGTEAWGKAIYDVIDEPRTIVYRDYFSDKDGTIDTSLPAGTSELLFTEKDGKTTITNIGTYATEADVQKLVEMGMIEGVTDTWGQLERLLEQ